MWHYYSTAHTRTRTRTRTQAQAHLASFSAPGATFFSEQQQVELYMHLARLVRNVLLTASVVHHDTS